MLTWRPGRPPRLQHRWLSPRHRRETKPPFQGYGFSHYLTKFGATALSAVSFKSLNRDDGKYALEADLSPLS
jgi:hypothetical protein